MRAISPLLAEDPTSQTRLIKVLMELGIFQCSVATGIWLSYSHMNHKEIPRVSSLRSAVRRESPEILWIADTGFT